MQWRFFNAPERGSITGNFAMLPGATREDTFAQMQALQETVARIGAEYEAEHGRNPIDYVIAEVGGTSGRGLSGADTKDTDQLGSIAVELIDPDLRPYSSWEVVGRLQDEVARHPLVETISFRGWRSGPGGDALDVELYGSSAEILKAAAERLKTELARFPEVSALEDSLSYDKEELILELTPQGQALGFTIDRLGRVLRHRLNGIEAATYPDGPRSAAIRVELPPGELTADFLQRSQMRAESGVYVPLADIVTVESRTGFSTVRRENGIRVVSVNGDISEDNADRAAEVQKALEEEILPIIEETYGIDTHLSGLAEQESSFLSDALTGLLLCLAGIYLTLAWVFSSWSRPVVVMAIIPFGLVGTIYGHAVWDVPLSMFSVIGLIGMVGIIINDSIVLVTTIDEKAETRGLVPAIIDGAADRLRPVLLTTLTTVLGLAPLLYEGSTQAQFLKPTVITLVFGLAFGLVLVLLVVPALVAVQHDLQRNRAAVRRAIRIRGPVARILGPTALALAALFTLTVGWSAVTGALPPAIAAPLPDAARTSLPAAFGLFTFGAGAITLAAWVIGASTLRPKT